MHSFSLSRLFFFALVFIPITLHAQKIFSEGVLIYTLTIDPPANQEGIMQYTGTYTITIKGQQVREDLKLDNGYTSVMLFDHKVPVAYSLRTIGDKKLAIQLDMQQMAEQQKKYTGFTTKEIIGQKAFAGFNAQEATITYTSGQETSIIYTPEWSMQEVIFDRFPGITVLPLAFSRTSDEGLITRFVAAKVEAGPVDNNSFRIPEGYKIVTNAEYKQLMR